MGHTLKVNWNIIHQQSAAMSSSSSTTTPLAYVFIRISPSKDCNTSPPAEDKFLVQVAHTSNEQMIIPTFSREECALIVNANTGIVADQNNPDDDASPRRLFSFPMPSEEGGESKSSENGDNSNTVLASVFECIIPLNEMEIAKCYPSYKVVGMGELLQMIRSINSIQHHPAANTMQPNLTNHILNLYCQHKVDSCVPGRRLLHGTSGSNIDEYTLRPKPAVVFFDCDDCLYFDDWVIAGHLTTTIEAHCQKEFGLPKGYAYTLYKKHGTALKGLIAEGYLSNECSSIDGYLEKVHDIPIHELLKPDAKLRQMILRIDPSIRKFVFTASVSHHAQRCLEALGIDDLIEGIIDVKDCQFETKHSVSSFHIAMNKAGIDNLHPEACVFVDDSVTNIKAAREVGWRSVLVGRLGRDNGKAVSTEHAEHEVDRIHQLEEVMPELFVK